jgi:hypothetical protein
VTKLIGVVEQMYSDFNLNVLALENMNTMIRICLCDLLARVPFFLYINLCRGTLGTAAVIGLL